MAATAAGGCGPSEQEISAFARNWEASVTSSDYCVQPPDALEISSPDAPEIDGEFVTIRQDGKVALRLVGEVKVAGMTPIEIARKLESLLARYYVDPEVHVRVAASLSKRYYVFGEVARRGGYEYTGRDTILDALALANPTFLAWNSQIKVIRPNPDSNRKKVIKVDGDQLMREGNIESNVLLQEGDIVYVPPSPVAWIGQHLHRIVYPLFPLSSAISQPSFMVTTANRSFDTETYR